MNFFKRSIKTSFYIFKNPDTFGDYLEMVIQYGLLEFFAPVFPLASMCALINNIIEIRSDAFKMCYLFQRPFGKRVSDIGKWHVKYIFFKLMLSIRKL